MEIFDTHCHYNLEPLYASWHEHWRIAQKNAITHTVVVGTDAHTSNKALEIATHSPNLFASVGYHPGYFIEHSEQFVTEQTVNTASCHTHLQTISENFEKWKTKNPTAIGEIGLDFFRLKVKGIKRDTIVELQKEALKIQLNFAKKLDLPVILHVRDQDTRNQNSAYQEVLLILKEQLPKRFVLHCASGPLSYIEEALEMGAYIGFDGNISYDSAEHLRTIFRLVPPDRILLETDAPYLAPALHKGEVCEPWMITETAHYVHEELNADLATIYQNSVLFFDIKENHIQ